MIRIDEIEYAVSDCLSAINNQLAEIALNLLGPLDESRAASNLRTIDPLPLHQQIVQWIMDYYEYMDFLLRCYENEIM